jgi:hypothetical protein
MAATYDDGGGGAVPVTEEAVLFSGYKDLVLLFELLRDHGRAAHALARLLVARDAPGDLVEARTLIAESERFLYLQGSLLESIFPELPAPGRSVGPCASHRGLEQRHRVAREPSSDHRR